MSNNTLAGVDVTATATSAQFTPGQHFTDDDGKVYKYVQYDTGAGSVAAVSGQAAYYYTVDGYKNHQVTSDLSDSIEVGAGILQSAPADTEWCWVQIKGFATMSIALTAGVDGDILGPTGATDGTLDVIAADSVHGCAVALDISDREIICDFPM